MKARKLKEALRICDQGITKMHLQALGCVGGGCFTSTGPRGPGTPGLVLGLERGAGPWPGSIISFIISASLGRVIKFIPEMVWNSFKLFPPISGPRMGERLSRGTKVTLPLVPWVLAQSQRIKPSSSSCVRVKWGK